MEHIADSAFKAWTEAAAEDDDVVSAADATAKSV